MVVPVERVADEGEEVGPAQDLVQDLEGDAALPRGLVGAKKLEDQGQEDLGLRRQDLEKNA